MGKKVFITYKYGDSKVAPLNDNPYIEALYPTTVRSYVDKLQDILDAEDHINKGEDDGEDLSHFKDSTIQSKLRDKIYDSSVTIIMISPNMKEYIIPEANQWIPWEISYSLREHTRNGRTSQTNAMLAVVLPNKNSSYEYYIQSMRCGGCSCNIQNTDVLFQIHKNNIFNTKKPISKQCFQGRNIYVGNPSYIHTVKWNDFILNPNFHICQAEINNANIGDYEIAKSLD